MSVFNSVSNALVWLMVILMVGGAIFGLVAAGTDLVNPITSQAEANRIEAETTHQKYIDQQEERQVIADADAYVAQTQIQIETARAKAESELRHQEQIDDITENLYAGFAWASQNLLVGLGAVLLLCMVIVAIGYSVQIAQPARMLKLHQLDVDRQVSKPMSSDLWSSENYCRAKAAEARWNEKTARVWALRKEQGYKVNHHKPMTWQDLLSTGDD